MNVKELKALLETFPEDLEVLKGLHSDYVALRCAHVTVDKAVKQGDWYMCSHATMSEENKRKEREYLIFE